MPRICKSKTFQSQNHPDLFGVPVSAMTSLSGNSSLTCPKGHLSDKYGHRVRVMARVKIRV